MLRAYLLAFGLTLAVEVPLYVVALTVAVDVPPRRAALVAVGVNVATHPAVWWTLRPLVDRSGYPWLVAVAEVAVCLVEWALLAAWTGRPGRTRTELALLAAVAVGVNAASTLAGLALDGLLPRG